MKTTHLDSTTTRYTDSNTCIVRMERNNRDLAQLSKKLSCYTCEPRTYSLYERIEVLRNRLDALKNNNSEIIKSLRGHKQMLD
ncbi:MAG: hypothetical protein WBG90_07605, partial [Saonia sp.]